MLIDDIKRIEDIMQEYADCQDDMNIHECSSEIWEIIKKSSQGKNDVNRK